MDDNAPPTSGGRTLLDGDEGDDVREPNTSLITNNSSNPVNNLLASAFIVPKYDLSGSHTVIPFSENITTADINSLYMLHFNNVAYEQALTFGLFILSAYINGTLQQRDH